MSGVARPRALAAAIALLAAVWPAGSGRALDSEGQAWFVNTARGNVAGNWKAYLEAQPRVDGCGARQLLLRPAIGYQITKSWSLWQGYAWTPSFAPSRDENRIFQQSIVETPRGELPVSLVHRTRFEQRWIQRAEGVSLRLRHMLRASRPLDARGRWLLAASDELFVTLDDTEGGPESGFDQNRGFVGIQRRLGSQFAVEVGYLNQFVQARPDVMRHVGLLWLDYTW